MAELTQAELAEMVAALDLFEQADVDALSAYLFTQNDAQRAAIVEQYYTAIQSQLTGVVGADVLVAAEDLAVTAADSLLRTVAASNLASMGQTISDGLLEGLGPRQIATRLDQVQGLDAPRAKTFLKFVAEAEASDLSDARITASVEAKFQSLLRDRRTTIARTETAIALSKGERLDAEKNGDQFKIWQSSGDRRVSDECQANEAQGPIPIKEAFVSGAMENPQHVGCRCSVTYIKNAREAAFLKPLTQEWADETAEAKEEA